MEGLCAWPTLQSSTFPQDMDLMYSDDLKDLSNTSFSVESSLVPGVSNMRNLEMTLDEALLTPEEVSREFEAQSAEIKPGPRLSSTTHKTVLSIAITALPTLALDSETASERLSFCQRF